MAVITSKCDLMQNAFPAGRLSLQGKFSVVEDINGEHMIFSVDKRGKLCLIVKGPNGHNELINLSASFGLDESSKVTALAVTQSRQNLIHLVFAVSRSDGYDDLVVVKPIKAERQAWLDAPILRQAIYTGQQSNVIISDILMGNGNDRVDAAYPQLYLTLKLAGKSTEDIWSITVTNSTASWAREGLFQMTVNPGQIISKCIGNIGNRNPGYLANYRGLFVLYKEASAPADLQLRFVGLDFAQPTPTIQNFAQPVPPGAKALSSFDNQEGWTDLVIYADSLLWRPAVECFTQSKNPYRQPGSYAQPADSLQKAAQAGEPKQMAITQAGDKISIWTLDTKSLLSYQEFATFPKATKSPPQALSPAIPLLAQSSDNDRFAATYNSKLGQKVFVVNQDGSTMSMLQQSIETRMWQSPIDVMIPDSDEIGEFLSHTIHIHAEDASKQPLLRQELLLSSSISSEMIVNGLSVRGSPSGIVVKTDEQGSLTVIIPAEGLAAPLLTVGDVPGSTLLEGRTITVDPMKKLWDQMAKVKTVKDLLDLQLPDGTPFVKEGLSAADHEKALTAIQDLLRARQEIASGVKQEDFTPTPASRQWGAWLWVKNAAEDVYEWAVEKIDAAWKFVVRIAGQVWEFIVENLPQVAAALQKVLEIVSKGWEWVKNKFEEFFPWKDILAVKNALVNITTAGMIMGSDIFASIEAKADESFQDLRKKVRDLKDKALPGELSGISITKDPPTPTGMEDKKYNEFLKSPQTQFGAYHLRYSGDKSDSGVLPPRTKGQSSFDRLYKRLSGIMDSFTTLALRFGVNITDLFSNKKFGLELLLAKVGLDLVEDALGVIQKAVTAILGSLSDLLLELADAMNADIKMPVIAPLYKSLTSGSRFTALDLVCLLLAIPATLAYKAFIGPLPTSDKGYQELTKPDVLKGALDLRMGRVKENAVSDKPVSDLFNVPVGNLHAAISTSIANQASPQHKSQGPSPFLQLHAVNSAGSPAVESQSHSDDIKGDVVDQAVMQKASGWWAEVGKPGAKILQLCLPVGVALYTTCYKLPKAMLAGDADQQGGGGLAARDYYQGQRKAGWKTVFKFVLWVGHGMILGLPKLKGIKDWSKDFRRVAKAAFNDTVFGWKYLIWAFGYLPVVGHIVHEYAGYCAEAIVGITQTVGLIAMHVDVYAIAKVSYPWYRCPEEYINALAKVAVAAAVLTQGKEPYTLGFAFGLTGVGKMWTMIRVNVEMVTGAGEDVQTLAVDDSV